MKKIDKIIENRFITIYGIRRETPNIFTEFGEKRNKLIMEFYKALKIPQLCEWLNKIIK